MTLQARILERRCSLSMDLHNQEIKLGLRLCMDEPEGSHVGPGSIQPLMFPFFHQSAMESASPTPRRSPLSHAFCVDPIAFRLSGPGLGVEFLGHMVALLLLFFFKHLPCDITYTTQPTL